MVSHSSNYKKLLLKQYRKIQVQIFEHFRELSLLYIDT